MPRKPHHAQILDPQHPHNQNLLFAWMGLTIGDLRNFARFGPRRATSALGSNVYWTHGAQGPALKFTASTPGIAFGNPTWQLTGYFGIVVDYASDDGGVSSIVSRDTGGGANPKWIFGYNPIATGTGQTGMHFNSGGSSVTVYNGTTYAYGSRSRVLGIRRNGTAIDFFRDGRSDGSTTISGFDSLTVNANLVLGFAESTLYANGRLNWVRIYNYAPPDAIYESLAVKPYDGVGRKRLWAFAVPGAATPVTDSDALAVALSESASVLAIEPISGSDTLSVKVTDVAQTPIVALAGNDPLPLGESESISGVGSANPSDTLPVLLAESPLIPLTPSDADTVSVKLTDTAVPSLTVSVSESLPVGLTEAGAAAVIKTDADTLAVGVTESVEILDFNGLQHDWFVAQPMQAPLLHQWQVYQPLIFNSLTHTWQVYASLAPYALRHSWRVRGRRHADSGTAQGGDSTHIILGPGASSRDGAYVGGIVVANGETRTIIGYVGATRTALIAGTWTIPPSFGDGYDVYNAPITVLSNANVRRIIVTGVKQ